MAFGYLARVLGADRYGDLEFALGWWFLFNLVIDAGLANYGAREVAKAPAETDALVGQIFLVRAVMVVVSVGVLAVVAAVVPRDPLGRAVILLQALALIPAPLILTWVFQARDRMGVVAVSSVTRQLILAGGVFAFVTRPEDVWRVPFLDASGLALAVVLQVSLFVRGGGRVAPFAFASGVRRVVFESAPLAASSVVWAVRLFAPLILLGIYRSPAETGNFAASHRLVIAANTFVWLYFFNLFPSMSRLATQPGLAGFTRLFVGSMRLVGWVACGGAAVGFFLAPALLPALYGPDKVASVAPFQVMVWILAVAFVSGHHRFGLVALGRERAELWSAVLGAVVAIVGCVILGARLTPWMAGVVFLAAETATFGAVALTLKVVAPGVSVIECLAVPLSVVGVAVFGVRSVTDSPLLGAALIALVVGVGVGLDPRVALMELVGRLRTKA